MAGKRDLFRKTAAKDPLDNMFSPEIIARAEKSNEQEETPIVTNSTIMTEEVPEKSRVASGQVPVPTKKSTEEKKRSVSSPAPQKKAEKITTNKHAAALEDASSEKKTERPSIYMTKEFLDEVKAAASMNGKSVCAFVNSLCQEYIDQHREDMEYFLQKFGSKK